MDYILTSDFHPLSTHLNAIWKLTFSNSPSTPLPCCPPSDCQQLWFSTITECMHVVNACIIMTVMMKGFRQSNKVLRGVYSDTTQLDVELSTRSQREQLSPINERSDPVDSVCRSWRHKQIHDWLGCTLFNWVSWVELSCVAINTPLAVLFDKSIRGGCLDNEMLCAR